MQAISAVSSSPNLSEVFPAEATLIGLRQRTKQGAIEEMVRHLVGLGHVGTALEKTVVEMVLAREKMRTTGVNGIAFPHCRSSFTEKFVGVVAVDKEGIPFDALDDDQVHAIFLILAPLERREQHFKLLGRIIAIGEDKGQRLQLAGCRSAEGLHSFLQELDRR
jgi:mannitol/fructose-specific phosphotransferase system IIA component (Ntr-type)